MTQALEVKKQTPLQEIRQTMESHEMKQQIKMALPPHIQVEKFIRVVTTAISNDPKLSSANRLSLYNACMKCAADGLIPDGKEAVLVTFGDQVTYMTMIGGVLKKLRNSGELAMIDAQVVYANDKFTYRPGIDEMPVFEPNWFGERGEAIGVYAVAKIKDGGYFVEIMNRDQVASIQKVSRSKTVWEGSFKTEMWRKSAIRRLAKRLPSSTDLEQVMDREDEMVDLNIPSDPAPKPEAPPTNTSPRLSAAVAPKATPAPTPKPAAPPVKEATVVEEPNEAPLTEDEERELPI